MVVHQFSQLVGLLHRVSILTTIVILAKYDHLEYTVSGVSRWERSHFDRPRLSIRYSIHVCGTESVHGTDLGVGYRRLVC